MNFIESIKMAFASLMINKLRSFLTMLGIIIGISAVITITTIGNSISKTLTNTFNSLGSNYLRLAITTKDDYEGKYVLDESDEMTLGMINELIALHPDELYVDMYEDFGNAAIVNENKDILHASVAAITDSDSQNAASQKFIKGRWINKDDLSEAKYSCMVTDLFVEQYFNDPDDAIGAIIPFQMESGETYRFAIVGIITLTDFEKKYMRLNQYDNMLEVPTWVYIPYNTLMKIKGEDPKTKTVNDVYVYWTQKCDKETAKQYCNEFFRKKYAQNPMWQVAVDTNEEDEADFKQMNVVLTVVTVAISLISAISLIVGGVGVMNIMLVSILERTREIGVRKALGALNDNIRSQFVIEAVIICLIGGIIGVTVGIVNGFVIKKIATVALNYFAADYAEFITITVQPSIVAITISLGFSMLTGLVFGYYPAKRAANMNPIDALRYE